MANAEPLNRGSRAWRPLALSLALWCGLGAGCVEMNAFLNSDKSAPPPPGVPSQIVPTWQNKVVWSQDTVNGGKDLPCLAGRLYLFDQRFLPVTGDGSLEVDMFNDMPVAQGGQPILTERWRIDDKTLQRLMRKDFIGWGYTMVLPLATYRPDLTQIHLTVKYMPKNGSPQFQMGASMSLNPGDAPPGVDLAKLSSPAVQPPPVQQVVAQQQALPGQPQVQPAQNQQPASPAQPQVQAAVYRQPVSQPQPVVPAQAMVNPPMQPQSVQPRVAPQPIYLGSTSEPQMVQPPVQPQVIPQPVYLGSTPIQPAVQPQIIPQPVYQGTTPNRLPPPVVDEAVARPQVPAPVDDSQTPPLRVRIAPRQGPQN